MRDVSEGVEGDDFMNRDVLKADGALAIEGTMMAAGCDGFIVIKPVVGLVGRFQSATDKVCFTSCTSLVGTKMQNN